MKHTSYLLIVLVICSSLLGMMEPVTAKSPVVKEKPVVAKKPVSPAPPAATQITSETLQFAPFNKLTIYQAANPPKDVVLFVSGDGGWNLGVLDMAKEIAQTGAMVVGIDIVAYLKQIGQANDQCSNLAAHFEALSHYLQKKYNFAEYRLPILVGYSSGATLVYAILAQAPPNTFRGAISLGFCPDLILPTTPCRGSGLTWKIGPKSKGFIFLPKTDLTQPWIALQGTVDQVCNPPETTAFVKQIPKAEIMILEKVGHGFSVPKNWLAQFKAAYQKIAQVAAAEKP